MLVIELGPGIVVTFKFQLVQSGLGLRLFGFGLIITFKISWTASPRVRVRIWTCSHFQQNETVLCDKHAFVVLVMRQNPVKR